MKQRMTCIVSILLALSLLAGCATGGIGEHPPVTEPPIQNEEQASIEMTGNIIGELQSIPADYSQEAEEQGQVVRLDYTTADYSNPDITLEKYAYVYLPYGFSATDPETRYDVLYLLHGGGGNAERYFGGEGQSSPFKRILDHLIQDGELEPILVVTPTFYPIGNTDASVSAAGEAVENFPAELVNHLIPAVEGAYPTYAETTDEAGLKASRDHRGFGGFSMGSVATWYVFSDCLDYFRYFLPMSGDSWAMGERAGGSDPNGTAAALGQALAESGYGENDFFIHALTGTSDMAYAAMEPQIQAMRDTDGFVYNADTSVGNLYFSVQEGGTHDYNCIRQYLYNAMPIFWGPEKTTHTAPTIDAAGSYSVETEEVFTENEGQQIYGLLYRPAEAEGPRPTVIYSHGFGSSYRNGAQYAQALAAQGYLVYCFDFRGGSESSRSEGSNLEMSIFTEQSDLEAVIAMMKERQDVDSRNIFLLGASQGGAVSSITAADNTEDVAGAVLLYPAFVVVDDAKERYSSVDEIPDSSYHLFMTVGRPYFENLLDYDIYEDIRGYGKDVLIIHGDRDSLVPLSYSERALEVYPSADLKIISGAGHGFSGSAAQQAIQFMSDFLQAHLN